MMETRFPASRICRWRRAGSGAGRLDRGASARRRSRREGSRCSSSPAASRRLGSLTGFRTWTSIGHGLRSLLPTSGASPTTARAPMLDWCARGCCAIARKQRASRRLRTFACPRIRSSPRQARVSPICRCQPTSWCLEWATMDTPLRGFLAPTGSPKRWTRRPGSSSLRSVRRTRREPRLTLTGRVILRARAIALEIQGEAKLATFATALEPGPEQAMPIRAVLRGAADRLTVFMSSRADRSPDPAVETRPPA